jgi:hypothetical protein
MTINRGLRSSRVGAVGSEGRENVPVGQSDPLAVASGIDHAERGQPAAAASALLSMGHISSAASSTPEKKGKRYILNAPPAVLPTELGGVLKFWQEGSRADLPGIPDLNPNKQENPWAASQANRPPRGNITEFSGRSRLRLKRSLATMKRTEPAHTMVLTLPGCEVKRFAPAFITEAFTKVLRRLSSTSRFDGVSGYWKRELQKRSAIHYHLVLYGIADDALRAEFQTWLVRQWTSFFADSLTEKQREDHRWWHARPENMQQVRDFTDYFSKYLGKDEEASGGLPGRWWGSFNKARLPAAPQAQAELGNAAAVCFHRLARKRRQKQIARGKHATAKLDKFGCLNVTPVQLWRLRSGYDLDGYRNQEGARVLLSLHQFARRSVEQCPRTDRFRGTIPNTAPIVLCGPHVHTFVEKAVDFVKRLLGVVIEFKPVSKRHDFTPDPLKPVPPGRTPRNPETPRFQADFLADLPLAPTRAASPIPGDYDFAPVPRRSRKCPPVK